MPTPLATLASPSESSGNASDRRFLDYFLVCTLIALSGNPVVLNVGLQILYLTYLALVAIIAGFRRVRLQRRDVIVLGMFVVISFYQVMSFSTIIISASLGFVVKLSVALLSVRAIKGFLRLYVNVIALLAAVSLVFYAIQQLGSLVDLDVRSALAPLSLLDQDVIHIGLHNFHLAEEGHRNAGFFWEPGAFAGYLILGIVALAAHKYSFAQTHYRVILFLLVATLLTTFSTTGFVIAPLALALHLPRLGDRFSIGLKAVALTVIAAVVTSVLLLIGTELPFIAEKISSQLIEVYYATAGWETSRFGSALYDYPYILERPIAGWSPHPITRSAIDPFIDDFLRSSGNGLTGFLIQFGLLGLLLFSFFTFIAMRRLFDHHTGRGLIATSALLLLLNGEQFLQFPLFLALMFV